MKKSIIALGVLGLFTIGSGIAVSAIENTNKPTKVQALMNEGKSFEDAKNEMLNLKLEKIDSAVESGKLSNEDANALKEKVSENTANCTEPGSNKNSGLCLELNKENTGNGQGNCNGNGQGRGNGKGKMFGNCTNLNN